MINMNSILLNTFQSLNFYPQFKYNFCNQNRCDEQEFILYLKKISLSDIKYIIDHILIWTRTSEGRDYWNQRNTDWKNFIYYDDISYIKKYIIQKLPTSIF